MLLSGLMNNRSIHLFKENQNNHNWDFDGWDFKYSIVRRLNDHVNGDIDE